MDSIIAVQIDISNRLGKDWANYKKSPKERITQTYVEVRLEGLETLWLEFCNNHKKLVEKHSDKISITSYVTDDFYSITQEAYVEYKVALKSWIAAFEKSRQQHAASSSKGSAVVSQMAVKLPKIIIPIFSGNYSEWVTFRDLFESLVHKNESIDEVQKMHYLKGYLTGEAERLLRQIPISSSNYSRCWELLKRRYNNKKFLCHSILKRFLSQRSAMTESASYLKELMDTSNDCLNALKNIGVDVSTWDVIVIHLLTLKLDPESQKQWELSATDKTDSDKLPTFTEFEEFLNNRFRALECIERKGSGNSTSIAFKPRTMHVVNSTQCPMCSDNHKIIYCKEFIKDDVNARRKFAQEKGLCFNCLGGNHSARFCQNPVTCRVCKRHHHSMLHPNNSSADGTSSVNTAGSHTSLVKEGISATNIATASPSEPIIVNNLASRKNTQTLLATALVGAQSKNGKFNTIRALLDQGSQASFVTEATIKYLGLQKRPVKGNISGLGGDNNAKVKYMVTINLQSLVAPEMKLSIEAYVLKKVTTVLPAKNVIKLKGLNLEKMKLADPNYHTPNKIDVLLGAEVYSQIIQGGVKKNSQGTLVAQSTSLGWVLSGVVNSRDDLSSKLTVLHSQVQEDEMLKKCWGLESDLSSGSKQAKMLYEEEKRSEALFAANTTNDGEGGYIVKLSSKEDYTRCKEGLSRVVSEKKIDLLEMKLNKNFEFKTKYKEVTEEYLHLDHVKQEPEKEKVNTETVYLPHVVEKSGKRLTWNRELDVFQHSGKILPMKKPVTKRSITLDIARLFGNVIISKVMIQKLGLTRLRWNEKMTTHLLKEWCTYRDDVVLIKEDGVTPSRWLLGRVVESYPGTDQFTRVIIVKLKSVS